MTACKAQSARSTMLGWLAIVFAIGCDEGRRLAGAPSAALSSPRREQSEVEPLAAPIVLVVKRAREAVEALATSGAPSERSAYLALRRALLALAPFAHGLAELSSEVMFGPPLAADEGNGALGSLDRARSDGNSEEVARQLEQLRKGLTLFESELKFDGVRRERLLDDLSNAAYYLGLVALEAYPHVPDGHDATVADLHGVLDGIALVAGAYASDEAHDIEARIAAAREHVASAMVRDRAELVLESGRLGVALRRLGPRVRLPYRARYPMARNGPDEPISAFVLPAPRHDPRPGDRDRLADLGRQLFFDRRLSRADKRSCGDCHKPELAFGDGLRVPASLVQEEPLLRNTPALLYAPLHAAQLWDGRLAGAERQALKVIHTRAEMGLTSGELERKLSEVAEYNDSFAALFADGVTEKNAARALAAYQIRDMVPGKAAIDRYARGESDALDAEARAGLDLFAGKARCARCHIPPFFGGSRPLDFATPVFAAIGVPHQPNDTRLDRDLGRGGVTGRARDRHAFKTPTVRNIARTAPYFHNGSFATLEAVLEFYDKGGGTGAGLELVNQDPEIRKLNLTPQEKKSLLAFMRRALGD